MIPEYNKLATKKRRRNEDVTNDRIIKRIIRNAALVVLAWGGKPKRLAKEKYNGRVAHVLKLIYKLSKNKTYVLRKGREHPYHPQVIGYKDKIQLDKYRIRPCSIGNVEGEYKIISS